MAFRGRTRGILGYEDSDGSNVRVAADRARAWTDQSSDGSRADQVLEIVDGSQMLLSFYMLQTMRNYRECNIKL